MLAPDSADLARLVRAHLADLRWADAEAEVERFQHRHPENAEGYRLVGEIRREQWRLDEAQAAFDRALVLDSLNAEARAGLGFVQIVRGRFDEGATNCRWALNLRSDLAAAHRYLASSAMMRGESREAVERAFEARRLAPLQPENSIILASAWFRAGLHGGGIALIDRVIADDPRRAEAFVTRAAFRLSAGKMDDALVDLQHGLSLKPWLPPAHGLLCRLHMAGGRLDAAVASIREARAANPFSVEYLLLEADLLSVRGEPAAAVALLEGDLWRQPKARDLRPQIAMLHLGLGQAEGARRSISGVRADATPEQMWRRLADIWLELGTDYDSMALACLQRAVGLVDDPLATFTIAQIFDRAGNLAEALAQLEQLDTPDAHALAGDLLVRLKRPEEALARLQTALLRHPDNAFCTMRLGSVLRLTGAFEEAETHLRRATELAPDEPVVFEQLGILLSDRGRFEEALKAFRTSAEYSAGAESVRMNIGVLLARQKRWVEAEFAFRALAGNPTRVDGLAKLAQVLCEQKRYAEAVELFEVAIERAPDDQALREGLVNTLRSLYRTGAAVAAARRWTNYAPSSFAAVSMLARQLASAKDHEADAVADRAWALSPDTVVAMDMRADVANQLGRYREAVEWYDRALAVEPDNIGFLTARGFISQEISPLEQSERDVRRVYELAPDLNHAQMNLSLFCLRLGHYEEGWRLYEYRDSANRDPNALVAARERAGGTLDLSQSTVLVHGEQGLGDTLQFLRYIKRLASECREIVLKIQDPIAWTARGLATNVRVFGYAERTPVADYHIALLSLPGYYRTDSASILADVPYLSPDPRRVRQWRERIGSQSFKVGVVWSTNPAHGNARRWIPLKYVAPIAEIPGVRVISLQKYHGLDQIKTLPASQPIETLGDRFDEGPDAFADAAAVIESLDLVITIDTSMAHLAGALARPVWLLLHRSADWRWLVGREDTAWYPTMRLFRQDVADDWQSVSDALIRSLRERLRP